MDKFINYGIYLNKFYSRKLKVIIILFLKNYAL